MRLAIINGPNLNLLGKREQEIYGNTTFESFLEEIKEEFKTVDIHYFQSNHEGDIIDKLQFFGYNFDGIILNAAAYSHTSIAIADAIKSITTPVVEVHISNVFSREEFRHHSYLSSVVKGCIIGFGLNSYKLAIQSFL